MELKESMVLTGLSALSYLGYSPFNPEKLQVGMIHGTNTTSYNDEYQVQTMSADLLKYKVIKDQNGIRYFSLERLFVELSRFKIEQTIKTEILKKLAKDLVPEEVKKVYSFIKGKTRGLDFTHVDEYLKNYVDIVSYVLENPLQANDYIREYVLSILGDNNIPILLKGGSAVELFIDAKRSTIDIDLLSGEDGIQSSLRLLTNKHAPLYLKLTRDDQEALETKGIPKLESPLYSVSKKLNTFLSGQGDRKHSVLKITFNKSLSDKEINDVIKSFQLSKRPLKLLKNKSIMTFSKEMLLAEKYHAIIIKPTDTSRSKDLFDLNQINIKDLDWNKFYKWLFRRFANNKKTPLAKPEALKWIKEHQDLELTKIKSTWEEGQQTYIENPLSYEEGIKVYKSISTRIINDHQGATNEI